MQLPDQLHAAGTLALAQLRASGRSAHEHGCCVDPVAYLNAKCVLPAPQATSFGIFQRHEVSVDVVATSEVRPAITCKLPLDIYASNSFLIRCTSPCLHFIQLVSLARSQRSKGL